VHILAVYERRDRVSGQDIPAGWSLPTGATKESPMRLWKGLSIRKRIFSLSLVAVSTTLILGLVGFIVTIASHLINDVYIHFRSKGYVKHVQALSQNRT
jgi:hypothetical protein